MNEAIDNLLKSKSGIRLDIGCGANKVKGFVGMDYRPLEGVDIVHDVMLFPWPLPDESVQTAIASHMLEHISPDPGDSRTTKLLQLLVDKKIVKQKDVDAYIGEIDPGPRFMRFMDEVWRVLEYDADFMAVFPYATSSGFYQDPTHVNHINEATWYYFDPLTANGELYGIYKPKPWAIKSLSTALNGNQQVVLSKRRIDPSYGA
jgi:hypothetical protein